MNSRKIFGLLFITYIVAIGSYVLYTGMNGQTVLPEAVRPCSTDEGNKKYVHNLEMERNNLKRMLGLSKACADLDTPQHTRLDPDKIQDTVWVEGKHSILYCGIPKVGCTFWKRTLSILASENNSTSPFQIKIGSGMKLEHFVDFKTNMREEKLREFLTGVSSFIFVRDPYSRLFSGYEHKLYNPNLSFWNSYGIPIVRSIRENPSNESLRFGHDVKFAEFVQYILKQKDKGEIINAHFKPMHEKCDPCGLPYDYIGHLETFGQDAGYLFDKWRKQFPDFNLNFDDFEKETALDTAQSLVFQLFKSWNTLKSSINYPFYNLVLRVWSDLQIRGYLSKDIALPILPKHIGQLTPKLMMEAVSDALEIDINRTAVKLQRQEALKQAYKSVSLQDMERLREYVLKDCQLFGYDDRPSTLFDRTNDVDNKYLYMKGI